VKGEATARLLPFPSVTFTDVEVAGTTPGEPAMTVENFSMDVELAPFMRGEVLIFDMRIVRPRARLSLGVDGGLDWAIRPGATFDPRQVKLEKVTVTEGRIEIAHAASGRVHTVTELNADVSAQSLAGPWRVAGTARLDGAISTLTINTGAAENGKLRLKIHVEPERYAFNLDLDGETGFKDNVFGYDGTFKLAARNPAPVDGQPAPPPGYRLGGKFEFDHLAIRVPEFRLETGPLADPYVADGHAEVTLGGEPRFTVVADGAQLRFDAPEGQASTGIALADRLAAFRAAVAAVPKPFIPGSIELKLPAIVAGDTTVREVTLSAEPAEDGWQIAALSAVLPGRATLEASGRLRTADDDFGFRGHMLLAVAQPSGFAAWLSSEVDEAIRRLPSAGFDADVDLSAEKQVLEGLELSLGGARFDGRIENLRPAGQRGSMTVDLSGGTLDFGGVSAFAALFVGADGTARLGEQDLDIKVKAGPVAVAGLIADTVDTQLRLRDETLEVDRLAIGGLEGADLSATGRLAGLGSGPSGAFDATLISGDLAPLVAKAAGQFPGQPILAWLEQRAAGYPGLLADTSLDFKGDIGGDGTTRDLTLEITGEAGGTALNLALTAPDAAQGLTGAPLSLFATAVNNEPAALYALAGLPGLPLGFAKPATLEVSLEGPVTEEARATLAMRAEGLELSFEGTVSAADGRLGGEGKAKLSTLDIEPWLMTAGISVPGMGLGLPVELTGNVDLREGLAVVSGLTGSIAGTELSGDINAEMRDGRPHLTGAVETRSVDLALAAEALFGEAAFDAVAPTSEGAGWPRVPFQPSARPGFTGELQITTDTLRAGTAASAANARLTARLDKDGLRVSDLSADIFGGKLGGLFELRNNGGSGLFSGQLTLDGAALPQLLPTSGLTGTGRFTGSLTANGKSVDAMIASLAGSGTASLSGLTIPGLRPDAFADLIAAADAVGPKVDAAATAGFAPAIVSGGSFDAGNAELAFTVASGAARAPAMRLERADATLTVEPRADFARWQVGASGELEYAAGDEAVAGGEPSVRFSAEGVPGAVAVSYDTEPLAQFLTQRAREKEQARVEAMQASLLERQRLRREVRYYASLQSERDRLAEELRKAAEAEVARKAAEEAALRAAEALKARAAAEEAARLADEAAAAQRAAREEADRAAAAAEEMARQAAEAERLAIEEEVRRATGGNTEPAPSQPRQQGGQPTTRQPSQPATGSLPGVNPDLLEPGLPRAGSNTSGSVIRPGTLSFGQSVASR
jgi:hypothetical protein